MKTFLTLCMSIGCALSALADAEVQLGDSRDTVYDLLGQPRSYLQYDNTELLCYDRGRLELKDGVVSQLNIMDDETYASHKAQLEKEARRQRIALQRQAAERFAIGSSLLNDKLKDAAFLSSPAEERIAYWTSFKKLYPEVGLPEDYARALADRAVELNDQAERAAEEERIARLEQRVADAEQRALKAEAAARVETYYVGSSVYVPTKRVYYPSTYRAVCAPTYRTVRPSHYNHHGYSSSYSSHHRTAIKSYSSGGSCSPSTYANLHVRF